MTYAEILRVRHMLLVVTIIVAAVDILAIGALYFAGHGSLTIEVEGAGSMSLGEALVRHHQTVPLVALIVAALFSAAIIATIIGCSLGRENETIASIWTKPFSRVHIALGYIGVDLAGLVLAALIVLAGEFALLLIFGAAQQLRVGDVVDGLVWMSGFALSIYGATLMLTSWRNRSFLGAYLLWPVGLFLVGLTVAPLPGPIHSLIVGINFLNPFAYMGSFGDDGTPKHHVSAMPLSDNARALATWVYAAVATTLGVYLWQRREA